MLKRGFPRNYIDSQPESDLYRSALLERSPWYWFINPYLPLPVFNVPVVDRNTYIRQRLATSIMRFILDTNMNRQRTQSRHEQEIVTYLSYTLASPLTILMHVSDSNLYCLRLMSILPFVEFWNVSHRVSHNIKAASSIMPPPFPKFQVHLKTIRFLSLC